MRIRSPIFTKTATWMLAKFLRSVARTCRYEIHAEQPDCDPADPNTSRQFIFASWHDAIMPAITSRTVIRKITNGNRISALASRHQDGTYLVEFMKHFRIDAVRGSTTRGGASALRKLLAESSRSHVWITPDGPRGPRREVKQGIVYLASQTGLPIIAHGNAMTRYWDIRGSWTNLTVPKPFSRVFLLMSEPISVPPHVTRSQIAEFQQLIGSEMDRMEGLARQMAAGEIARLPSPAAQVTRPRAA